MNLDTYKLQLKKQLIEGCEEVTLNLFNKIKQNIDLYDTLIILQANLRIIKRKEIEGTIAINEIEIRLNKIRKSLLEIINSLSNENLISPYLDKKQIEIKKSKNNSTKKVESFCEKETWGKLEKIGDWNLDETKKEIIGIGAYKYLLSEHEYGKRNFTITAKIVFEEIINLSYNAGIILGWVDNNEIPNRRYFNILMNSRTLTLEGIGLYGGDDFTDFTHFDSGVKFQIEANKEYEFAIICFGNKLSVFVNSYPIFSIIKPDNLIGKVGIRPWRSKMRIQSFNVNEI